MAVNEETIANSYPLQTYRFQVKVGDETMAFNRVSSLQFGRDTVDYKDGMGGRFRMLGQKTDVDFSLSRGVVKSQSGLWEWLHDFSSQREKKDVMISLTNEAGTDPLYTVSVANAFPTSLSVPDFDATSNEVAIEELSLSADSLAIEYH